MSEPTSPGDDFAYGSINRLGAGNIKFDDLDLLGRESLRVVTVLAGDVTHGGENSMTRASEEFRSIATEASAGAGDQNYLCS